MTTKKILIILIIVFLLAIAVGVVVFQLQKPDATGLESDQNIQSNQSGKNASSDLIGSGEYTGNLPADFREMTNEEKIGFNIPLETEVMIKAGKVLPIIYIDPATYVPSLPPDTDGDGVLDGDEGKAGTDPNDASDF